MPFAFSKAASLQKRRRFYVAIVVATTLLFLFFFNLGSYFFIKRMGGYLELELDKRLRASAMLITDLIERDLNDLFSADDQTFLRLVLSQAQRDNDLEAAFLIDDSYHVLADARYQWALDVSRGYLQDDSTSIAKALSGNVDVSPLHVIEGSHFKSVYAPIQDTFGNTAVLVLEASADFFDVLQTFKRGLYVEIFASIVLLLLLTVFLFWAVTLLLKTEDRLHRSEHLAAMGQMAATMAHEIRNPLSIIKGTAEVLKERYGDHEQPDELYDYIPAEIQRLDRLVNDFLSLSREPQLKLVSGDINEAVEIAVRAVSRETDSAGIQVEIRNEGDIPPVLYDTDAIHQVMLNLLLNAIHAMGNAGGLIRIRVFIEKIKSKPAVAIEVTDTGPGFDGDANLVFEPFYTTKTRGTGLGLAVCRRLIEQHGGRIEAISKKNKGTTIRFFLPCA